MVFSLQMLSSSYKKCNTRQFTPFDTRLPAINKQNNNKDVDDCKTTMKSRTTKSKLSNINNTKAANFFDSDAFWKLVILGITLAGLQIFLLLKLYMILHRH